MSALYTETAAFAGTSGKCCGTKDVDTTTAPASRSEMKTRLGSKYLPLKIEHVDSAYQKLRLKSVSFILYFMMLCQLRS